MMKKIIMYWGVWIFLVTHSIDAKPNRQKSSENGKINFSIHATQNQAISNGIIFWRAFIEKDLENLKKNSKLGKAEILGSNQDLINILEEKPKIIEAPYIKAISFHPEYSINDQFIGLGSFFMAEGKAFFFMERTEGMNKRVGNGICRLNSMKWYDLVTVSNCDELADLGYGRLLALNTMKPRELVATNIRFRGEKKILLSDERLHQDIFKLDDNHFFFHNFRVLTTDCTIEIYNLQMKRQREFFNYVPYKFDKKPENMPVASQTVVAGDGRGKIYIAFCFDANPYRVWIYNGNGEKLKVFGNFFEDADEYDRPWGWYNLSLDEVRRWGIERMYVLQKLLIAPDGNMLVFFTKIRIPPNSFAGQEKISGHIDAFDPEGRLIGRAEFPFGTPMLVDGNNFIYAVHFEAYGPVIEVVRMMMN